MDAAIEKLYRDRYLGFRRALGMVTGSHEYAHASVQDGFARAFAVQSDVEEPMGVQAWRAAVESALARSSQPWLSLEETLDAGLLEPVGDSALATALAELPPLRRTVFFLRYFAELRYREIAALCHISEAAVTEAVERARADLTRVLGESTPTRENA